MTLNSVWTPPKLFQRHFFWGVLPPWSPFQQYLAGIACAVGLLLPVMLIAIWLISQTPWRPGIDLLLLWTLWDGGDDLRRARRQFQQLPEDEWALQKFYRWYLQRGERHLLPLLWFALGGVVMALLYRLTRDLTEQWPAHGYRYRAFGHFAQQLHRGLAWPVQQLALLLSDLVAFWPPRWFPGRRQKPLALRLSDDTGIALSPTASGRLPRPEDAPRVRAFVLRLYGATLLLTGLLAGLATALFDVLSWVAQ